MIVFQDKPHFQVISWTYAVQTSTGDEVPGMLYKMTFVIQHGCKIATTFQFNRHLDYSTLDGMHYGATLHTCRQGCPQNGMSQVCAGVIRSLHEAMMSRHSPEDHL